MKRFFVLAFLFGLVLTGAGCAKKQTQTDTTVEKTGDFVSGVALSPKSYAGSGFKDFLKEASDVVDVISWAGASSDFERTSGAPYTVAKLARQENYTPVFITSPLRTDGGVVQGDLDEATQQATKENILKFVEQEKPLYFGFGNEINLVHDESPEKYETFVTFFSSLREEVKNVSPDTKFFVVFQLEQLKGLKGGLFGGTNNTSNAQWDLLEDFASADLIAFTTYPSLIYDNPSDIPKDYYQDIGKRTNKPVAFSEVGWPSNLNIAGYSSDEGEQKTFVERFSSDMKELQPEFMIWLFLYDQETAEPFRTMGLKDRSDTKKPAYDAWKAL